MFSVDISYSIIIIYEHPYCTLDTRIIIYIISTGSACLILSCEQWTVQLLCTINMCYTSQETKPQRTKLEQMYNYTTRHETILAQRERERGNTFQNNG